MGPFAGILALAVPDTGTLAKLFAEAIENVEKRQVEGIEAAGANGIERARFGILPQVLPVMLSHVLYFFESNTRSATILGVVGAGGIGLQLAERIRLDDWQEVAFIILLILVTVAVIDWISGRLRRRIIAA
jgi:phosphonate transport system permease protein